MKSKIILALLLLVTLPMSTCVHDTDPAYNGSGDDWVSPLTYISRRMGV